MDPDIERKIASGDYSVSPRTGRVRKKIRTRKKSFFSVRKMKKWGQAALWILLLLIFIVSLVMIIPELNINTDPRKAPAQRSR